jgi:flagellar biosynthetic protein FlhB
MADEFGEKTEEATPHKRQEAREEGRIPKSQELSVAFLLLGGALMISTVLPSASSKLMALFGSSLASAGDPAFSGEGVLKQVQMIGWRTLGIIAMLTGTLAAISLVVNAAQARGTFSTKPIMPDFNRINPVNNIKRMVGTQAVAELLKSLLKLVIIGVAVKSVIGTETINHIVATAQESPAGLLEVVRHYAVKLLMTAGLSYLALAGADYAYQYWNYLKQMRMTKEEVKQEFKNSEGDPQIKHRMRSIARNNARKRMFQDVPNADLVIVNPTHRAVALKYDPMKAPAPYVLAMGERKIAERIKKIAYENGVPVIENRPLAIALIKNARVGMMIPAELYLAVAEVLAFVLRQRRERKPQWGYQPVSHLVGDHA